MGEAYGTYKNHGKCMQHFSRKTWRDRIGWKTCAQTEQWYMDVSYMGYEKEAGGENVGLLHMAQNNG
jgi:hypothetical protein